MKNRDKSFLYRRFSAMMTAGISFLTALTHLSSSPPESVQRMAHFLLQGIQQGDSLASRMEKADKRIFESFEIAAVRAGEISGTLAEIFENLADHYESQAKIVEKLLSGLTYPILLLHAAILIPAVPSLFLSGPLRFFLSGILPLILLYSVVGILLYGIKRIKDTPILREEIEKAILAIPLVGPMIRDTALIRGFNAYLTLYKAGVPVIDAIPVAADATANIAIKKDFLHALPFLKEGNPLSMGFSTSQYIRPDIIGMLKSGEESGTIDAMLGKVLDYLSFECKEKIERFATILPVLLYLIIAAYIAFIVISFYTGYLHQINTI